jgi:hypothetical protein
MRVHPYTNFGVTDEVIAEGKRLLENAFEIADPTVTIAA